MQDFIKRNFWMLGAVVAMTCAAFAAKAVTHVAEAAFLGDSEHGTKVAAVVQTPQLVSKPVHTKDGAALASRNMFCSDCKPPEPVTPVPGDTPGSPSIVLTTLPLQLLATNVGTREEDSFASIVNTETQSQGSYGLGDRVPGASGVVKEIHYKYIDFENAGHTERLGLMGAPPPVIAVAEPAPAGDGSDDMQALVDAGVKKLDDNTFEIDRALVDKILANPMAANKGARIVPAVKNGKPDGFKLYAIRPTSVYAKLGLTNGDTIEAINGMELTSADQALEVYTKLKDATQLQVDGLRRGKPITMKYTIH
jgi:general secretion pathway protein C